MRNFRNYDMWKNSLETSVEIYQATRKFPSFETYGLADQLRRASVSVVSNIAEGAGRKSEKDFAHFLEISMGSAYEVETQLYVAHRLGYIPKETLDPLLSKINSIERQLYEMIHLLTSKNQKPNLKP